MPVAPHEVWQTLYAEGDLVPGVQTDDRTFAATLPDGRRILLPIRVLPGGNDRAVASLILNQASFAVLDALADALVAQIAPLAPEVIVAVPTLGLPLAEAVARRLGHGRMVPLGTSRKFWYDEALSEPLSSITSPGAGKRIYLDPRMLPVLEGRRVLVVDDVISTGASMAAVLRLLAGAGLIPVAVAAAMLQGAAWRARLAAEAPGCPVIGAFATPILTRGAAGWDLP